MFLKKVEKQQQENHKVFTEIEKNIGAYEKHSSSKTIFNTKNKNLPVRGQVFQPFGKQNEKISFYHKKGILMEKKEKILFSFQFTFFEIFPEGKLEDKSESCGFSPNK